MQHNSSEIYPPSFSPSMGSLTTKNACSIPICDYPDSQYELLEMSVRHAQHTSALWASGVTHLAALHFVRVLDLTHQCLRLQAVKNAFKSQSRLRLLLRLSMTASIKQTARQLHFGDHGSCKRLWPLSDSLASLPASRSSLVTPTKPGEVDFSGMVARYA